MPRRFGRLAALSLAAASALGCAQKLGAPTAVVSAPATVATGTAVQADGTGSSDPQALPLAFHWQVVSLPPGSRAVLNDPGATTPSFVADLDGTYVVELVVFDGKLSSNPATATIQAGPCGDQALAVVIQDTISSAIVAADGGGGDGGIPTGAQVQLAATITDPNAACLPGADAGAPESFGRTWAFVAVPSGSHVKLNGPSLSDPSFVADVPGQYVVSLAVTSPTGMQGQGVATITVGVCGSNPPQIQQIVAAPATPAVGMTVGLSPTVLQPDNQPPCSAGESLSYQWSFVALPAGSRAQINAASVSQPSFVPDLPGLYAVRLEVVDSLGHLAQPQTLSIVVSGCGGAVPVVTAITSIPSAPGAGEPIQVQATISDADATGCGLLPEYAYAWQIVGQPAGSHATLNNPAASAPSFSADVPGSYNLALVVTKVGFGVLPHASNPADGGADAGLGSADAGSAAPLALAAPISSAMFVQQIAVAACGSNAPVLTSISFLANPTAPVLGQATQLSASFTDADNAPGCALGRTFSYQWTLTGLPQGSQARLNAAGSLSPSFVPDVAGAYSFSLTVTDNLGRSSTSPTGAWTVNAVNCGLAQPVITLPSIAVDTLQPAQLGVGSTGSLTDANTSCASAFPNANITAYGYAWSLLQLPSGSKAGLSAPNAASPSFVPDVAGTYTAQVVVTDGLGNRSQPALQTIVAAACGSNAPVVAPGSFLANPGAPVLGQITQISASFSDADNAAGCALGRTLSYQWTMTGLPQGSQARLNSAVSFSPSFVPDVAGVYGFSLTVTDNLGRSSTSPTGAWTVNAANCGAAQPVVRLPLVSVDTFQQAQLGVGSTGSVTDANLACASAFPNANVIAYSYAWTLLSLPAGSKAGLSAANSSTPSLVPDVPGSYTAQVVVTDGLGNESQPSFQTIIASVCGSAAPVPNVGVAFTVCAGLAQATVGCQSGNGTQASPCVIALARAAGCGLGDQPLAALTAAGTTDADQGPGCNLTETFSYNWQLLVLPVNSGATLAPGSGQFSNSLTPWFTVDASGLYVLRLSVGDGTPAVPNPPRDFYIQAN